MSQHTIPSRLREKLARLYPQHDTDALLARFLALVDNPAAPPADSLALSERDVMLITYGDQVHARDEAPLATLRRFLAQTLAGAVNCVHILPFYPYTSDDGFSVVDYEQVNPALGDWSHIDALKDDYRLMFDAVFNHISASSAWFRAFLRDEAPFTDYFVTVPPDTDLSQVVRPRTLPLLTPFETSSGTKHVWTTFSADQIDVNAANPEVVLELTRILLDYVKRGAQFIRLDAIAFMWKIIGTPCIHLPETHLIIQLWRDMLDLAAPQAILITETNVPHHENVSYFGDGTNEAQLVYNFALPPLVLHTLSTGDAADLTRWARTLTRPSERTTFFNFTASHDGIGVRPVSAILPPHAVDALVERTLAHGGRVSYRSLPDGSRSPYELNISYFDAITAPDVTAQDPQTAVSRFVVSQAIALTLMGMPALYFHSLFGSRSDTDAVIRTGQNRSINRAKLDADTLLEELRTPESLRARVYGRLKALLKVRTQQAAFHPLAPMYIHDLHPSLFVVARDSRDGAQHIMALHNVSGQSVTLDLSGFGARWHDLISGEMHDASLTVAPYQVLWLTPRA